MFILILIYLISCYATMRAILNLASGDSLELRTKGMYKLLLGGVIRLLLLSFAWIKGLSIIQCTILQFAPGAIVIIYLLILDYWIRNRRKNEI